MRTNTIEGPGRGKTGTPHKNGSETSKSLEFTKKRKKKKRGREKTLYVSERGKQDAQPKIST